MNRVILDHFEHVNKLMKLTAEPGLLLCSLGDDGKPNAMTIGWCNVGIIWARPIFIVHVRPSRYTYTCLEQSQEFTVNVVPASMAKAAELCGTLSGRDNDKFQMASLEAAKAKAIKTPVIDQSILCYECKVVHHNDIISTNMPSDIIDKYYPQGDHHRIYFGQIVSCHGDVEALKQA